MREMNDRYAGLLSEMRNMRKTFREIALGYYERKMLLRRREEKKKRLNRKLSKSLFLLAVLSLPGGLLLAGIKSDPRKIPIDRVSYPEMLQPASPKYEKISDFVRNIISGPDMKITGKSITEDKDSVKIRSIFTYFGKENADVLCERPGNGGRFMISLESDKSNNYRIAGISAQ